MMTLDESAPKLAGNLARVEANKRETGEDFARAQQRERDQKRGIVASREALAVALTENEVRRDAMAEALAEDCPYDGPPLHDIARLEAGIDEAERLLSKIRDVRVRKNRADNEAMRALYMAQATACLAELARRGWTGFNDLRWPVKSLASFTLGELAEMEQLLARAQNRAPSLSGFLSRISGPDWRTIDVVGRAFDAARSESR